MHHFRYFTIIMSYSILPISLLALAISGTASFEREAFAGPENFPPVHNGDTTNLVDTGSAKDAIEKPISAPELKNNSLSDLFRCSDLTVARARGLSKKPAPTGPGNHIQGAIFGFTLHDKMAADYPDKGHGFLVRRGDETYFINVAGTLVGNQVEFEAGKTAIFSNAERERGSYVMVNAPGIYRSYDSALDRLSDSDERIIPTARIKLSLSLERWGEDLLKNLARFAKESKYGVMGIDGNRGSGQEDEAQIRRVEAMLVEYGAPSKLLSALEACRSALAPNSEKIIKLITELNSIREPWEQNYATAVRIQKIEERIKRLREQTPAILPMRKGLNQR